MATKIHILKPDLANKIAAGEVVQRPASAVKELIENALDAHATAIHISVKDAGKTWIQVAENGEGMSAEDALLSLERHATSKIATPDDLENIRTLGFRGEALASIAAVAQVELRTRQASDEMGTSVRVEGSQLQEQMNIGMEPGTTVIVKNLFYNTPARRNFLKTRTTELKNIMDAVTRMAVAYPEVSWTYISDDETLLDLKHTSKENRIRDILGNRQADALISLHEVTDYISVDGFLGKPNFARKSRSDQFLYINRRFVINRAIQHAVFHAYEHLLEKGAYPFFILHLTLDPRTVDVNVHPSKMEIKFENESNVYRFVLSVVRKTLAAHDLVPTLTFRDGESFSQEGRLKFVAPGTGSATFQATHQSGSGVLQTDREPSVLLPGLESDVIDLDNLFQKVERRLDGDGTATEQYVTRKPSTDRILPQAVRSSPEETGKEGRAIWQVHHKYILSQIRTGLLIVDQHVAHERILYERALANFENSLPSTQQLLFPHTVELTASDYSLVKEMQPHLERLGFDLKLFGKNTVIIEGIPADVRLGNEAKILQEVLDEFKNNEHAGGMDARDRLAKSFACKAAVKAGDKLNTSEMISLIDHLFATSMPYVCPHGRPVVVKISIEELDRRFGRT